MKKITMAILGFGQRGKLYADIALANPTQVELVAVCETKSSKNEHIINNYKVNKEKLFNNEEAFFAAGKLADFLVISSMDADHYKQSLKALEIGYDILLEKPIALNPNQVYEIKNKANSLGRKIAVAHVLRYTSFYQKIKSLVDNNMIGRVVTLNQTENIGYFHFVHSYVRGNWHNTNRAAPIILAKSSHDLDIIRYLMGSRIKRLSSFGNLLYFKKENAPVGSTDNCFDCKVDCPFNAIEFYNKNPKWFSLFSDEKDITKYLSNKDVDYGKCVYKMDNNASDHQVVNFEFENGSSAAFVMTGLSNENHRKLTLHGSLGEIDADMDDGIIKLKRYGKPIEIIHTKDQVDKISPHAGGDARLFLDFVEALAEQKDFITNINYSVESHIVAFAAEESRLNNGQVKDLSNEWSKYGK